MKVSIDGILHSARKINSERQTDESAQGAQKKGAGADSVSIGTRINSRLDAIETELKDIQSSLTKNQIVRDGLEKLVDDMNRGGARQQAILNEGVFEGKNVLRPYVGEAPDAQVLQRKKEDNTRQIGQDVDRLRKLQVELDNMSASSLAGQDRAEGMMKNMDSLFKNMAAENVSAVSRLRPDSVMRLITQ